MKILHLINNLSSDGSAKLLMEILPLMKSAGHEVNLVNFRPSTYNPMDLYRLIKLLRQEQYDIIHAHGLPTQFWLALAAYFIPGKARLIKTEYSIFNKRHKSYLGNLEKMLYSRYACVIAITPEVAKALQHRIGYVTKIQVILKGINMQEIENARAAPQAYTFLLSGCYHILMVGHFNGKAKDQTTVIRAMQSLPKNFHLYFAGEGELMPKAKQLVAELRLSQRVHFLGLRNDVLQLMQQVDLNVLSSTYEDLSHVALQKLASGKPFLGTGVDGIWNVVPDQRYLFPAGQAEVLASRIMDLADHPALAREMGKKGMEHVQQYEIREMVSQYLRLYQTVSS